MTARKHVPARRLAPPGWYHLQDAAGILGISPNTMTRWADASFVHVGCPDGDRPLVSAGEVRRVLDVLWGQRERLRR